MAERLNRDPTYDLARHIATGEKVPLSGEPAIRQYDAELDRDDPMEDWTRGSGAHFTVPLSNETINASNLAQALDMQTGEGRIGQFAVDMQAANDCHDEPSKEVDVFYGNNNTGRQGGY